MYICLLCNYPCTMSITYNVCIIIYLHIYLPPRFVIVLRRVIQVPPTAGSLTWAKKAIIDTNIEYKVTLKQIRICINILNSTLFKMDNFLFHLVHYCTQLQLNAATKFGSCMLWSVSYLVWFGSYRVKFKSKQIQNCLAKEHLDKT